MPKLSSDGWFRRVSVTVCLDFWVPLAYSSSAPAQLITVAETPLFQRQAKDVWDENEREDFVNFIARNP
jgi:hypothetical protein